MIGERRGPHYGGLLIVVLLAGCARSSTIPLAQDTIQITARAAPVCGAAVAQKVAFRQAAVETIRHGYDLFVVVGAQASGTYVGATPVVAQPIGGGGIMVTGGTPVVAPTQGLIVKMFRQGDPAGSSALSARDVLGPNWQELASRTMLTCFD